MEKLIKTVKIILKIVPFISAIIGVFSLALSKYEEKQGNYSREFSEIEDEMKLVINEVRSNGK
jgi:hypothetical protein